MRAIVQALRRSTASSPALWAARRDAALAAAAVAGSTAAAGQPCLREFLVYHWGKDRFQSHTMDIAR